MEHVDFTIDDAADDGSFEELGGTTSQMISRISMRDIVEEDTKSTEVCWIVLHLINCSCCECPEFRKKIKLLEFSK